MSPGIVSAAEIRARITASGIPDIDTEAPRLTPVCGTYRGWTRHRRAGEQGCQPCLRAKREYRREYERARRAATTTTTED